MKSLFSVVVFTLSAVAIFADNAEGKAKEQHPIASNADSGLAGQRRTIEDDSVASENGQNFRVALPGSKDTSKEHISTDLHKEYSKKTHKLHSDKEHATALVPASTYRPLLLGVSEIGTGGSKVARELSNQQGVLGYRGPHKFHNDGVELRKSETRSQVQHSGHKRIIPSPISYSTLDFGASNTFTSQTSQGAGQRSNYSPRVQGSFESSEQETHNVPQVQPVQHSSDGHQGRSGSNQNAAIQITNVQKVPHKDIRQLVYNIFQQRGYSGAAIQPLINKVSQQVSNQDHNEPSGGTRTNYIVAANQQPTYIRPNQRIPPNHIPDKSNNLGYTVDITQNPHFNQIKSDRMSGNIFSTAPQSRREEFSGSGTHAVGYTFGNQNLNSLAPSTADFGGSHHGAGPVKVYYTSPGHLNGGKQEAGYIITSGNSDFSDNNDGQEYTGNSNYGRSNGQSFTVSSAYRVGSVSNSPLGLTRNQGSYENEGTQPVLYTAGQNVQPVAYTGRQGNSKSGRTVNIYSASAQRDSNESPQSVPLRVRAEALQQGRQFSYPVTSTGQEVGIVQYNYADGSGDEGQGAGSRPVLLQGFRASGASGKIPIFALTPSQSGNQGNVLVQVNPNVVRVPIYTNGGSQKLAPVQSNSIVSHSGPQRLQYSNYQPIRGSATEGRYTQSKGPRDNGGFVLGKGLASPPEELSINSDISVAVQNVPHVVNQHAPTGGGSYRTITGDGL